jgi:alpha-L-fucosidase 2
MMRILTLAVIVLIGLSCSREIKVACIGDSITEGWGLTNQSTGAYPAVLNKILGPEFQVINCGRSGATLLKDGDLPFWSCKEFYDVFAFNPEIIVIMLGTNDTKPQNWDHGSFVRDYQALIDTFSVNLRKPDIYLCLPVPVFETTWGINDSVLTRGIFPVIQQLVLENKLKIIDLYHPLLDQRRNFPDNVHPNEKAAEKMAEIVAGVLKNRTR